MITFNTHCYAQACNSILKQSQKYTTFKILKGTHKVSVVDQAIVIRYTSIKALTDAMRMIGYETANTIHKNNMVG